MNEEPHCPVCGSKNGTITDIPAPLGATMFKRVFECECGEKTTFLVARPIGDPDALGN
jgi:hypothetical protein